MKTMDFAELAQLAKDICSVAACAALLCRPIRERILGTRALREGQRCLLRGEIVRLYYRHHEDRQLREYEFKNMRQCYEAYKALGGNSFIDRIEEEMRSWEIV